MSENGAKRLQLQTRRRTRQHKLKDYEDGIKMMYLMHRVLTLPSGTTLAEMLKKINDEATRLYLGGQ